MECILNPISCVLEEIYRNRESDTETNEIILKDCRDVYALLPLCISQKDGIDRLGKYRIFPSSTNDSRLYCMDEASNQCGYMEAVVTSPSPDADYNTMFGDMAAYEASIRIVPDNDDAASGKEISHLYFAENAYVLARNVPLLMRLGECLNASYDIDDIMAAYKLLRKYHPCIRTEQPTKLQQALMTLATFMSQV